MSLESSRITEHKNCECAFTYTWGEVTPFEVIGESSLMKVTVTDADYASI